MKQVENKIHTLHKKSKKHFGFFDNFHLPRTDYYYTFRDFFGISIIFHGRTIKSGEIRMAVITETTKRFPINNGFYEECMNTTTTVKPKQMIENIEVNYKLEFDETSSK